MSDYQTNYLVELRDEEGNCFYTSIEYSMDECNILAEELEAHQYVVFDMEDMNTPILDQVV